MKILSLRSLWVVLFLLALLPTGSVNGRNGTDENDGTLVVHVTWGDDYDTPANDVYIEAHGYVRKFKSERSFVLKSSKPGSYEAELPPGVYDVFVSEGTSVPVCRRMRIQGGLPSEWTLRLKIDMVFTDK